MDSDELEDQKANSVSETLFGCAPLFTLCAQMEGKGAVGVILNAEGVDILTLGPEPLGTSFVQPFTRLPLDGQRKLFWNSVVASKGLKTAANICREG